MKLRPYQAGAVAAAINWLNKNPGNPCVVIPTGGGKTIIMAEMIRYALTRWPNVRILVLAHVRELVQQNADKLLAHWPEGNDKVGVYSAGLGRRDVEHSVIFASIQSVVNRAHEFGKTHLVLVDEAHRIPLSGDGRYIKFLDACREINPKLRVCGMTATPYRLSGGPVCGPDYILQDIAYEANVGDLIKQGYLCKLTSKCGSVTPDVKGVRVRNGDYVQEELARAVDTDDVVEAACSEMVRLCADRKAWIVFCANVAHAEHVTAALKRRGVRCAMIDGNTPMDERDESVAQFQSGTLKALVNINVLSEGFDATHIDAVILMRPTKSAGLYYQQVGRGLRLDPRKENTLILDYSGNLLEHGPIDAIQPPRKPGEKAKSAPAKKCPECSAAVPIAAMECMECGYQWPEPEDSSPNLARAIDAPVLSIDRPKDHDWHKVTQVSYAVHHKKTGSGPPTLRVTYQCGLRTFKEWVCFEHPGYAGRKAISWWERRAPHIPVPERVCDAVLYAQNLDKPSRIRVREIPGKFAEVIQYEFATEAQGVRPVTRRPQHASGAYA